MGFLSVAAKVAAGVGNALTAMAERHAAEVARYDAKSDTDLLNTLRQEVRSGYPSSRSIAIMRKLVEERGLNVSDIQVEARRAAAKRARASRYAFPAGTRRPRPRVMQACTPSPRFSIH